MNLNSMEIMMWNTNKDMHEGKYSNEFLCKLLSEESEIWAREKK